MPVVDPHDLQIQNLADVVAVEEYLNTLVLNLANLPSFNTTTPIQELGIDSFGAMQFVNEVRHRYGIDLSPRFVFNYPTTGGMAARIAEILLERQERESLQDL